MSERGSQFHGAEASVVHLEHRRAHFPPAIYQRQIAEMYLARLYRDGRLAHGDAVEQPSG
jgi:hypothetical protein